MSEVISETVKKSLVFINAFMYEDEPDMLLHPDPFLHGGENENYILSNGGKICCSDIPSVYKFSEEVRTVPMHFQAIKSTIDDRRYLPLFESYRAMTKIFGIRMRVGLICYETAKKLCKSDNLAGIVIGPGTRNKVVNFNDLEL